MCSRLAAGCPRFEFESTFHVGRGPREYNIREVTAEYREGARCSSRTGERRSVRLPDVKELQTLRWQGRSGFRCLQLLSEACVARDSESQRIEPRIPTFARSGRTLGTLQPTLWNGTGRIRKD